MATDNDDPLNLLAWNVRSVVDSRSVVAEDAQLPIASTTNSNVPLESPEPVRTGSGFQSVDSGFESHRGRHQRNSNAPDDRVPSFEDIIGCDHPRPSAPAALSLDLKTRYGVVRIVDDAPDIDADGELL